MKQLKDKVIIVTGGAGLIGKTVVNGINDNGGLAICADISGIPSYEHNFIGDITSELSVKEMFEEATNKYGIIHGLVNSAYPRTSDWGLDFTSIPYASWQKNVDMQLNSCFYINQKFIEKALEQQKPVSIINIASIYGIVGPDFSIYGNTRMTTP